MNILKYIRRFQLWRFSWHFLLALLAIAALTVVIIGKISENTLFTLDGVSGILFMAAFWVAFFAFLLTGKETITSLKQNTEKLENVVEMINRNNSLLAQIAQASRLSNSAKEIAFRDIERMELAEAVIGKLHQHEFESTFAMIDAIAEKTQYKNLAVQLGKTAEKYRDATEKERINQATAHIIKLGQEHRWVQAYRQADNLIKAYPYSEEAKNIRRKLRAIKDSRKKELLAVWDKAVKAKDTDHSLEILKELDSYLTPSEGLALQESAASVFKTKLHNLGVQFALAVTENRWAAALETGQEIMRDFPNSRMSHEIRGKLDILQDRAQQNTGSEKTASEPSK